MGRRNVSIVARFTSEGAVTPISLLWEDGRIFSIDRVMDKRKSASTKAGGLGLRYTCMIHGKQTYLYKDEDIWFMETDERE